MSEDVNPEMEKEENDHDEPTKLDYDSIPDEFKHILADSDIPEGKKGEIIKAALGISYRKASSFSGPIPPPEILEGYNKVINNGAERIIVMAEKQSNHRMQLEDHAIKEELKQSRLGQVFGFILGIVGLGLATFLAIYDHDTIAGIFGTTTIVGLVTVFVLGKRAQQQDLKAKEQTNPE